MIRKLQAFFNPERFQGWNKKKRYFEGWYYKMVDTTEKHAFAIIPGISMDEYGEKHAFIQVLDGKRLRSGYHKFDYNSFFAAPGKFQITIQNNRFSEDELQIDLPEIHGRLAFRNNVPWPKPFYSPGIMGPYAFVPFMECYHGIVSMDHSIRGSMTYNNENICFDHGRGYIEKDWGRSFPCAYFWLQSNHFSRPGISLKASVAKIPWLKGFFVGFICGIWVKNKLIRFTTYNKTVLKRSFANEESVELVMENKKYRISINAYRDPATVLAAPVFGLMKGRIEESMNAKIKVRLMDLNKNRVILADTGRNAALEVAGDIQEIFI
jgi:tocopherol cyclase